MASLDPLWDLSGLEADSGPIPVFLLAENMEEVAINSGEPCFLHPFSAAAALEERETLMAPVAARRAAAAVFSLVARGGSAEDYEERREEGRVGCCTRRRRRKSAAQFMWARPEGRTGSAGSITGFSSEIGTKLPDWAVGQAGGSCYSRAASSSNDSKTLYERA